MTAIEMVPIGNVDRSIVEFLSLTVGQAVRAECYVSEITVDPRETFDPRRGQYYSTQLLAKLLESKSRCDKILGIADVDLFIPVLTFVFGEAQLGNRAAVMSVHRLRQEFYGLLEDERLFYERCEKEAVHELGHSFGLIHCRHFDCVMHFSNSIEQVDLKSNNFCSGCLRLLSQSEKPK